MTQWRVVHWLPVAGKMLPAIELLRLEFNSIVYKLKGYAVATDEQLERIEKVPKREFIRRGINQHTLEKICNREPVRAQKRAKCLKVLEEYEEEQLQKCTTQEG